MSLRDGRDLLIGNDPRTLTEWQWAALATDFNLSDAHARDSLLPAELDVLNSSGRLFASATEMRQTEIETRLVTAIFRAAREPAHLLTSDVSFLLHYSASVSIELTLKALVASQRYQIGIIDPCFDSIPQLARRSGLSVRPVSESVLTDAPSLDRDLDALFLVVPNNPTGWTPTREAFRDIASHCSENQVTLIVDCSFRFFDTRLDSWSIYRELESFSDLDYCVIEDTGKTWPLKDLKLGLTVAQAGGALSERLHETTDELLLNVSPFLALLLSEVIELADDRHPDCSLLSRRRIVEKNRSILSQVTAGRQIICHPNSQIGAAWLEFPSTIDTNGLARTLAEKGLSVLPGAPFTWSNASLGSRKMRLALTRDKIYFEQAMYKLDMLLTAVLDE